MLEVDLAKTVVDDAGQAKFAGQVLHGNDNPLFVELIEDQLRGVMGAQTPK
jgi:hypothetical protein